MAEARRRSTRDAHSGAFQCYEKTSEAHAKHSMCTTYFSIPLYQFAMGGCDYESIC